MLSENIKRLRNEKGMTQKDLADELHVTAQAVSRWETGEVEPSIGTLTDMSKIFNVSVDEIIDNKNANAKIVEPQVVTKTEYVVKESKPVLAVCEKCNKPIYDGNEIVRYNTNQHVKGHVYATTHVRCKACDAIVKKEERQQAEIRRMEIEDNAKKQRRKAFWWGLLIAVACLVFSIAVCTDNAEMTEGTKVVLYVGSVLMFPFISCLFFKNNFILEMVAFISSWGFVRLPGLIFSLDLDGIIWLITVKLAFWLLTTLLSVLCFLLAIAVGLVVSVFVYPFALAKSIKNPEETEFF